MYGASVSSRILSAGVGEFTICRMRADVLMFVVYVITPKIVLAIGEEPK